MKRRILEAAGPVVGLLLFGLALWVLHHELELYHYHQIARELAAIPAMRVLLALAFAAASYLLLTGYDLMALRYARHPLPYRKISLASFVSYALSHNIGLSMISAVSARVRLYSAWGLSALEIAQVVAFCGAAFWLGFLTIGGLVFLLGPPPPLPSFLHLPFGSIRPVGLLCLTLLAGYFLLTAARRTPLRFRSWEIELPSPGISLVAAGISSLDWLCAGAALYVLLPSEVGASFPQFMGMFLLAQVAGLVSQVPGGLGVFETVLLVSLSPGAQAPAVMGSLLAYRAVYYLLPLLVAVSLLAAHELALRREELRRALHLAGQWSAALAPNVLAFAVFVSGAVLLFSGATPALRGRLAWLDALLPLPVIEVSHFLGSLVGVGLLLLARGLQRRLDAAYHLTALLLGAGIVLSLLKGLDYEEAAVLGLMLAALMPCRSHFYRKASLTAERFTVPWVAAVVLVLLGAAWLVVFSHKHVEYAGELWWRFTIAGEAPRSLRATAGAACAALVFALARLLRPARPAPARPDTDAIERARIIAAGSSDTSAWLALVGDKQFLFSDGGTAFIMYAVEGRSWIALGDPVGPEEEISDLVWRFREMSDLHDGWTVFYLVHGRNLHAYLDIGLTLLKLGEEARVPLEGFSLEGSDRKGLRHVVHRLGKEGCGFEVVSPERARALLPDLRRISDSWLDEKNTREKGFSLGRFDQDYLSYFPAAIVRKDGRVLAFANVLTSGGREELSIDLMRHVPEAPNGIMDYLLAQLMLWGHEQGYGWFNLGMAPLAGLPDRALAPFWNRLGAFVFRHGEHFYNFQGLRQYKEKFLPVWEPRYLASRGGLAMPRVLANLATLISGGLKGVVIR